MRSLLRKTLTRLLSTPKPKPPTSLSSIPMDPIPIYAGTSVRRPLSLWPGMYHSPVTTALWEARSSIFEWMLDPSKDKDAPPQTTLLTRAPAQSRTSIVYNFSTDYILREQYRDPWNEVKNGKLLEDLDALAGAIAVKWQQAKDRLYIENNKQFSYDRCWELVKNNHNQQERGESSRRGHGAEDDE